MPEKADIIQEKPSIKIKKNRDKITSLKTKLTKSNNILKKSVRKIEKFSCLLFYLIVFTVKRHFILHGKSSRLKEN
jgi:hypothetical protein